MSETSVIAYMSGNAPAEVDATHPLPVTNTPSGTQTVDTELPAAAALNGTIAKSVAAPVVGAALMVSDGTNLVQPLGDAANGQDVDVTRLPALAAGENPIGTVGAHTLFVRPAITVDTAAYAAGDTIGGIVTVANAVRVSGGTGLIQQVTLTDNGNQKPALEIRFFESSPAAGTYTDNNPTVLHITDQAVALGRVTVATSDWLTTGSIATATLTNVGVGLRAASGTSVFMVITAGGTSAPDFILATDLQLLLVVLAD